MPCYDWFKMQVRGHRSSPKGSEQFVKVVPSPLLVFCHFNLAHVWVNVPEWKMYVCWYFKRVIKGSMRTAICPFLDWENGIYHNGNGNDIFIFSALDATA